MPGSDYERFANLTFDDFRRMATDDSLSRYEKIGFPDEYRTGFERAIAADIAAKLPNLSEPGAVVLDIGPGCSDLPRLIRERCEALGGSVLLVDSEEMLAHHPDEAYVAKFAAQFPNCPELFERFGGQVDAIIAYSVLHYVFPEQSVHAFLDAALTLLAPGGGLLIGDIPNVSMRKRWFASARGQQAHREVFGDAPLPDVNFNVVEGGRIDDAVVLGLVSRARAAGYDAFVVPQGRTLPMANRREDLLIMRP